MDIISNIAHLRLASVVLILGLAFWAYFALTKILRSKSNFSRQHRRSIDGWCQAFVTEREITRSFFTTGAERPPTDREPP